MGRVQDEYRLWDRYPTPDNFYVFLAEPYEQDALMFEGSLYDCREWIINNKGKKFAYLDEIVLWREAPDPSDLIKEIT